MTRTVALVGTGLIGASIGLAAKRGDGVRVRGFDPDAGALEEAAARGAVDESFGSVEEMLAGADLAVVAAPVTQLPAAAAAVLAASSDSTTVTDVGSTKAAVCAAAGAAARFVG